MAPTGIVFLPQTAHSPQFSVTYEINCMLEL